MMLASFISSTRLCISGLDSCRNWRKVAIRGRIFLSCLLFQFWNVPPTVRSLSFRVFRSPSLTSRTTRSRSLDVENT